MSSQRNDDLYLLKRLGELPVDEDHEFPEAGKISESESEAFRAMAARLRSGDFYKLTDRQRIWAKNVLERATEAPEYLNLASSGKLARGREVPLPEVLRKLPLKPPTRKKDDDGDG